jgi:hypothetical protein
VRALQKGQKILLFGNEGVQVWGRLILAAGNWKHGSHAK